MKSITITKNEADQRLDRFLTKRLPNLPQSLMYKYIRKKRIKVNRKRAEISTRLHEGDVLDLYINDEFFERPEPQYDFLHAPKSLSILYEDDNLLVLDKKVGLLSHPDKTEYVDTLITRVKRYLYEKGEYDPEQEDTFTPSLINRIDRNTGGIVLAAKNAETLRIMNRKMKDRELHKYYLCVVYGHLPAENGVLEGYLVKNEEKNRVKILKKPTADSKKIRTKYQVLKTSRELSLVEVELLTGRTHQIRAHFASIGCPLLGDGKYGKNDINKRYGGYKKQFLYSYKLVLDFKTDAGILNYLNHRTFTVPDVWFAEQFPRFSSPDSH